jgi:hypothetical protein
MKLKYLEAKLKYLERKNIMMLSGGAERRQQEELLKAMAERGSLRAAAEAAAEAAYGGPRAAAAYGGPRAAAAYGGPSFTETRRTSPEGLSFAERRQQEELEKAIAASLSGGPRAAAYGDPRTAAAYGGPRAAAAYGGPRAAAYGGPRAAAYGGPRAAAAYGGPRAAAYGGPRAAAERLRQEEETRIAIEQVRLAQERALSGGPSFTEARGTSGVRESTVNIGRSLNPRVKTPNELSSLASELEPFLEGLSEEDLQRILDNPSILNP